MEVCCVFRCDAGYEGPYCAPRPRPTRDEDTYVMAVIALALSILLLFIVIIVCMCLCISCPHHAQTSPPSEVYGMA